jgi:hypothetical protein
MILNKTARANLMYIAIVIGIIMLLPIFNRLMTPVKKEKYKGDRMPGAIVDRSVIGPTPSTLSITMGKM